MGNSLLNSRRFVCIVVTLIGAGAFARPAGAQSDRDAFYWLNEINKASAVMVVEQGIVPLPLGTQIANAVAA